MSNLTIVDLDFCESELLGKEEIKGGITVYSPSGNAWSSSNSSGYVANYSTGYSVDKNTNSVSYYVAAQTGGAVAGAVAGAAANGSTYVGTTSTAFAS